MKPEHSSFYSRAGKRCFDVAVAAIALALVWPLFILVGAGIWLVMGRPVLFRQRRPGAGERAFTLLKFRTMLAEMQGAGDVVDARERVTPFGLFLRVTSLDELPQLWNVLRGEMSLVGPRPLLERYLPAYTPDERRRHSIRPGITGWAQVLGRNNLDWNDRLALDVWYVDHLSFRLDLVILARTAIAVLSRRGVRENPASFMQPLDEERLSSIRAAARF